MSKHKLAQTFKSKFKSKHIFVIQTTSLNRGCQISINNIDAYKETFFKRLQLWQEEKSFKKTELTFHHPPGHDAGSFVTETVTRHP